MQMLRVLLTCDVAVAPASLPIFVSISFKIKKKKTCSVCLHNTSTSTYKNSILSKQHTLQQQHSQVTAKALIVTACGCSKKTKASEAESQSVRVQIAGSGSNQWFYRQKILEQVLLCFFATFYVRIQVSKYFDLNPQHCTEVSCALWIPTNFNSRAQRIQTLNYMYFNAFVINGLS